MKRLFLALTMLGFLICTSALPVSAAGKGNLSLGNADGTQGDTVTVAVKLNSNPGLITMKLSVVYSNELKLIGASDSGLLKGWTAPSPEISSPYTIRWADSLSTANNTKTGKIATLTFKIKNTASVGAKKVSLNFEESYNATGGKNSFVNASANIIVKPKSTKLKTVKAVGKGFVAKWKKQRKQITGYQLQYSAFKKFKSAKTVTVKRSKTITKTVKKLKSHKKYYVRIRTYKKVKGTKFHSSWSKVKSVITK